jgi:V/A-type H+-transporting ATPase subunit I
MSFSELGPVKMARVAVVVPSSRLRAVLVAIAAAGVMELDETGRGGNAADDEAARLSREVPKDTEARLSQSAPDLDELRDRKAWDLLAGEAALARRSSDAVAHGPARILVGWVAERDLEGFTSRLAEHGASVLRLPRPRGLEPPTRMPERRLRRWMQPLIQTYAVVPYEDVDPSLFAVVTYVLMFGMMFGDVGHGLILAALGVLLGRTQRPGLQRLRRLWFFPVAA